MSGEPLSSLVIDSPLGRLLLVGGDAGLAALVFMDDAAPDDRRREVGGMLGATVVGQDHPLLHRARRQLLAWFGGRRHGFSLPLDLDGTPFQMRVWEAIQRIPYGDTQTYGELASGIGRPKAARAVAHAAGRNPVAVLVPCHRLVAADGALGGYGGGRARKMRLLALERNEAPGLPLFSVATRRAEDEARHRAQERVLEALPAPLRAALLARIDGAPGAHFSPGEWLDRALAEVPHEDLPVLADLVADRAGGAGGAVDAVLRSVADDLVGLAAAHVHESPPTPTQARCLLHAVVAVRSHWYELVARRLVGLDRLSSGLRRELEGFFEAVMEGEVDASSYHRERTVDLWLGLRARVGEDHWVADRQPDRSAALARLGLWREAALLAEEDLATGRGDRRELVRRLVDLYEHLEDWPRARDHLLALVAERPDARLLERLRHVEDRLGE